MALPRIEPVRPTRSKTVPVGREWVYELKLDGFRGVLSVDAGIGSFTSKTAKPLPRFRYLAAALARALPVKNAILDGEIIVMGEVGPDFNALFFRKGTPAYAAFDLLWLNGKDLRPQPYWRRKRALKKLVEGSAIGYVDHVDDPELFSVAVAHDLEGVVAKRRSDPYGAEWVKVKHSAYTQVLDRWELFQRRKDS